MSQARQRIRFVRTSDGVQLAWEESGAGPLLVKASNWLTHLAFDWESPVWRHWVRFFSDHFRFVRYDERGCGMSDSNASNLSIERWVDDFETIVDALDPTEPFPILGISQGAAVCIGYAVRHPERVSKMILYGGYARGFYVRGNSDTRREYAAVLEAMRVGWGKENPAFRQLFTSRFIPGGTIEQLSWFSELARKSATAEAAAAILEARGYTDVVDLLPNVRVPTLVIHARDDSVVSFNEGRLLASTIPGAQFVELPGRNHVLLEGEPAWPRFQAAVLDFLGVPRDAEVFASLSKREREILALITDGLGNNEIADRLSISEKTVRNHISSLYDKLGVWTRAQAMVFARDHRFRG
ncbi:MAG TPA: alpha/beta fold hydrolase [Thermoanaerobaculia bacterium]|nr:alpha/beta fold hydrolase [Thermoanaerobaculia bacterium]